MNFKKENARYEIEKWGSNEYESGNKEDYRVPGKIMELQGMEKYFIFIALMGVLFKDYSGGTSLKAA